MGSCTSSDYVLKTDVKVVNTTPSWLGITAPREYREESFKNLKPFLYLELQEIFKRVLSHEVN